MNAHSLAKELLGPHNNKVIALVIENFFVH